MYFAASLFVAFAITLFLVSKIAKMLNAKRPNIEWVLMSLIFSGALAAIPLILLGMFVQGFDPNVMLAITLVLTFIVSSAAYKYLNQLNWSGAFTLNIASIAIGLLTAVAAIVFNGESVKENLDFINISAKNNVSMIQSISTKNLNTDKSESEIANDQDELSTNKEDVITELDLLPARAVNNIKKKEKRVYKEPKFRVISINNIHSAVGYRIKIHRKNGNTIIGGLKRVDGNDAVISQYTSRGTVIMPISMSKINKLEVYR